MVCVDVMDNSVQMLHRVDHRISSAYHQAYSATIQRVPRREHTGILPLNGEGQLSCVVPLHESKKLPVALLIRWHAVVQRIEVHSLSKATSSKQLAQKMTMEMVLERLNPK